MQLCQEHSLVITNGRTPGDMLGKSICYNNMGASVVDYVICDNFLKHKRDESGGPNVQLCPHTHRIDPELSNNS